MKRLLIPAMLLGLAGCAELERMNAEHLAQQRANDENQCAGYGFNKGTDAFATCMQKLDQNRQWAQAEAARRDAEAREREADREAANRARQAAQDQQNRDNAMRAMETGDLTPDIDMPSATNCTTTTDISEGENAGSMTATTDCSQ